MCEDISGKYLDNEKIQLIQKKLIKNVDNPKLKIDLITLPDKRNINIIQDGILLVGTIQRVVKLFIKKIIKDNPLITTLIYTGTSDGFGALAIAYAGYKLGLKCNIYLSGDMSNKTFKSRQITTLQALGANIKLCSSWDLAKKLMNNESYDKSTNIWKPLEGYYIAPLGLNDNEGVMTDLLSKQIIKASKNILSFNLRIWLVVGSGGIASSISKAFPNAKLFIYLRGSGRIKKIIEWANNNPNITILNSLKINNTSKNNRPSYYSSVSNYDDMIWPYIKKYGLNGDYIWNIASDDYILF